MRALFSTLLKTAAYDLSNTSTGYWVKKILDTFGIITHLNPNTSDAHIILRQIYHILKPLNKDLIRDCGVRNLLIKNDMGPNKPFFPNHGWYKGDEVALNADMFYHPDQPDDFYDFRGYFLSRPQETLYHEFGHSYDARHNDLSLQEPWLRLSGWNQTYKPGLKRLIIQETGAPEIIGEWFYNPSAGFTRFYGKRNPYDDWADCFAFFVGGLKSKLPANKIDYFKNLLKKYSS